MNPPARDLLLEADHAEKAGDAATVASLLREHLSLFGEDAAVRLRLGRLLVALHEPHSARQVLLPLDVSPDPQAMSEANRLLARLDENEGSLGSAQMRWERVLADDVDDPEAHARLRALGPHPHLAQLEDGRGPSELSLGTLVSPEGVQTSRFRLVREIGRGTSATVYLVRDQRLDLPLALKVLHPQLAAAARAVAREKFFAEARLAARLRHPGVVAVYGVDEAARCLVMEFVAGGTLRERLRAVTSERAKSPAPAGLDAGEVLATARSLLGALTYVHEAGIVHGDLKPGNLLLRQPAEVVLADFGVAALSTNLAGPSDARLTDNRLEDRPAGTPLYLAPEQFRGAAASTRTDLFAAGAILWELAQGRPARRKSELLSGQHTEVPPLAPETLASLGDDGLRLASVIGALMASDPDRRPSSADAALATLTAPA